MSDEKYVGAIAAAKNAALTKAALDKKLDKTGGTITGSLKVDGIISAGMSLDLKSGIDAGGCIHSEESLLAPALGLYNGAKETSVSIDCSGDNAAKITSLSSDGKSHYARLAVGTPTGDNDAATKAYVDAKVGATVYVDFWWTGQSEVYDKALKAYTIALSSNQTYDAVFDLISSGANVIARLYEDSSKTELVAESIEAQISGDKTLGNINFLFLRAASGIFAGFPTIADAIWVTKTASGAAAYALYKYCALPIPAGDSTDSGKVPTINGKKWEMKKVDVVTDVATESTNGLMSASDKEKLNGIATGATRTTVDRLLLDNSDNPVSNRVLKAALDAKAYKTVATAKADGLMSASDKSKLDGIEFGANKTIVDAALDASSTNPVQNKVVKAALDKKAGKDVATAKADGLMSAVDKVKLDGIEEGATKTIVDDVMSDTSTNPVQNKAVKAALDSKLSTRGGEISGYLDVGLTVSAEGSVSVGRTSADTGIHFEKAASDAGRISHGSDPMTGVAPIARLKVADPTEDDDVTTKKYVDDRAVRYDAKQTLTSDQKFRACQNIGAVNQKGAWAEGAVMLLPSGNDGASIINITPGGKNNDYTLALDGGPENVPVRVSGIETPTDAQTDCATNVAYVKAKVAEVAASGGVDVDNALSATSTNPVQNKVIKAALDKKAGTAVATTSANGLMSKADKTKLNGIAEGATKITIDSAMSGSSNNPVANHVIKQYVDDKVAAAGSNITVDATLSSTSANPVQNKAVKAAIDAKADKTALDAKADKTALNAKLDKTGGTLTGNLTGKYITGTWLQSTAASDLGRTPGKIAVLDDSGWVYYRTPAELVADLGIANAIKSYVDAAIIAAINSAY